ncbi:uncharacterized protein RDI95_013653 [Morus bassanus]
MVGFMGALGRGGILAQWEFDRRFSPRFLDWAAFGTMTLPSIGMLLLWDLSERKYDTPKTKEKRAKPSATGTPELGREQTLTQPELQSRVPLLCCSCDTNMLTPSGAYLWGCSSAAFLASALPPGLRSAKWTSACCRLLEPCKTRGASLPDAAHLAETPAGRSSGADNKPPFDGGFSELLLCEVGLGKPHCISVST